MRRMGSRVRGLFLAALASSVLVGVLVACSKSDATPDKSCTGQSGAALTFSGGNDDGFCGTSPSVNCVTTPTTAMANKQLALTFDDGPSGSTLALSAYLKSQGIRAAFFVNGHCFGPNVGSFPQCQQNTAATPADIFNQVLADGHIVENHTQDHNDLACPAEGSCYSGPGYPNTVVGNAALIKEISDTDTIVSPFIQYNRFLFRAPYGRWSAHDYTILHASAMDKYYGPVKWDIGGAMTCANGTTTCADNIAGSYAADWDCWENLDGFGVKTTAQCATRYMQEISFRQRGIVLFHDADYGDVTNHSLTSGKGNSIDMVKLLIEGNAGLGMTGLKAQGYTFIRVDEVPDIAAALPAIPDAGPDASGDAASDASEGGAADAGSSSSSSSSSSSGSMPDTTPPAPSSSAPNPCAP